MVSFANGGIKNLHGVRGVKSGRRCSLPLWFTLQKEKIEDNSSTKLSDDTFHDMFMMMAQSIYHWCIS